MDDGYGKLIVFELILNHFFVTEFSPQTDRTWVQNLWPYISKGCIWH